MGHMALYRQFRPVTFDEIVEQKHAVSALRQSVISGKIGHAYLFCGTRGTGKTSIAKIFSRAINCLAPRDGNPCNECEICRGILDNTLMDVIEMDAASNNSVDNIRRICDEVMFLPSRARYKVYIIDEVHMLSGGAFNALLKTLEEPPEHAVFLLATTEPHRIPATIISRCQRYDFRRIPTESMVLRLKEIADAQKVSIDHNALVTISNLSDGALRDAISLLDQVSTGVTRNISRDDVLRITGVVDDAFLFSMANALLNADAYSIISLSEQLVMDGRDIIRFTLDLAHYFRDLMVICVAPQPDSLVQATSDSLAQMKILAQRTSSETLVYAVTKLSSLVYELKWSPDMRTSFEIALLSFKAGANGSSLTSGGPASEQAACVTVSEPDTVSSASAAPAAPAPFAAPAPAPSAPGSVLPPASVPAAFTELTPAPASPSLRESTGTSRAYMAPPPIEDMFKPPPAFAPSPEAGGRDSVPASADAANPSILPLSELWAALLHKWEDTMFSDALQMRQAKTYVSDHIFYLVFPDSLMGYAKSLTGRADYKKISKDILTVIPGITSVEIQKESSGDENPDSSDPARPPKTQDAAQPDWVAQMLAFSEATGIPVETLDNL